MLAASEVLESPEVRRVNFLCEKIVKLVDTNGILRDTISIQKDYIHQLESKLNGVNPMADYTFSPRVYVNFTRQDPPRVVPKYKKIWVVIRKFFSWIKIQLMEKNA